MKSMFVVALLIAVVADVCGEPCGNHDDCVNLGTTNCASQYHVMCNAGQCECTAGPNGDTCHEDDQCTSCPQGLQDHCVHGHCHCAH